MKADTIEVMGLFDKDVRYLIPIFQRNYKWQEKGQWAPLWTDLSNVAQDVLEMGESGEIPDHFLGAIVCEQIQVFGRDAQAVSVIDGQQRLTTLALFIAAILDVAKARELTDDAEFIAPFVTNKESVVKGRVEHRFKVWPNVADRTGFLAAMVGEEGSSLPQRASRFFADKIGRWLDEGIADDPLDDEDFTPAQRMVALTDALTKYVKLVKIDLEPHDNAQLIFETLNGRGEHLTDADLIRNALFRKADEEGEDAEALHKQHWTPFDETRWAERIAHGRHQRDRLSLFFNHWLSMKLLADVPAGGLFQAFNTYVRTSKLPASVIAKDLAEYGRVFDSFDLQEPYSKEWWFFRRIAEMDLITVYPVLLWLFGADPTHLSREARGNALTSIESFLVRRLLRRDTTRSYGAIFVELLREAGTGPIGEADIRIAAKLGSNTADFDRWPTNADVRGAVANTNVYKLKQSRLKMILEAIEWRRSQSSFTETVTLGHKLWIEHLLPQGWKSEPAWALPADVIDPERASMLRDHRLHTLGNLTLTTSALDISLSNRPWPQKLVELGKHSSLKLNRDLISDDTGVWNEDRIDVRGAQLAEEIIAIWPTPATIT